MKVSLLATCVLVTVATIAVVLFNAPNLKAAGAATTLTDRPLNELLAADEISRSEMHNVLAPQFSTTMYYELDPGLRLIVSPSDAEVIVIGKARITDGILTNGQLVLEDDVVVKGLLYNDSEEDAEFAIASADGKTVDAITLGAYRMISVGEFIMDIVPSGPCGVSDCINENHVPCCWMDGTSPQSECMTAAECDALGGNGGVGAVSCDVSKKGCKVKCGGNHEACCWVDSQGKAHCICAPVGECPQGGSGARECRRDATAHLSIILVD